MCLCFIATGASKEQTKYWEGYRTVEVLGWHQEKEEVHVLFIMHLLNKKNNNALRIFHPGNVRCDKADFSNGFPLHQDEKGKDTYILETIYGKLLSFDKETKTFHKKGALTAWDSIHTEHKGAEQEKEEKKNTNNNKIIAWPVGNNRFIKPLFKFDSESKFAPFSAWELGPFENEGEYLVALHVTMREASYKEFVKKGSFFIVDGPQRLRDRMKYWYIPNLPAKEQEKWQKRISEFEDYLPFNESYDVVTLGKPLADRVIADMDGSTLITEGPLVSSSNGLFKRYITGDASFKLSLSYEDGLFKNKQEISFAKDQRPIALSVPQI